MSERSRRERERERGREGGGGERERERERETDGRTDGRTDSIVSCTFLFVREKHPYVQSVTELTSLWNQRFM